MVLFEKGPYQMYFTPTITILTLSSLVIFCFNPHVTLSQVLDLPHPPRQVAYSPSSCTLQNHYQSKQDSKHNSHSQSHIHHIHHFFLMPFMKYQLNLKSRSQEVKQDITMVCRNTPGKEQQPKQYTKSDK